jgi:HlyD family secretion protein
MPTALPLSSMIGSLRTPCVRMRAAAVSNVSWTVTVSAPPHGVRSVGRRKWAPESIQGHRSFSSPASQGSRRATRKPGRRARLHVRRLRACAGFARAALAARKNWATEDSSWVAQQVQWWRTVNLTTHAPLSPVAVDARRPGTRSSVPATLRTLRWIAVVTGAIALSAIGWRLTRSRAQPLLHYQTSVVDEGPITAKVTASGTLSATVTVQIGSQVSGRIDHLYVDFNSPVKAGQLIATIEPSFFRAAAQQARANQAAARAAFDKAMANWTLAERTYGRQQTLFGENLVARADLDAAEAQAQACRADIEASRASLLQADASLEQAQLNLSYTRIVSPIDGIVLSRAVDVGQTVAASFQAPTLFTVARDLTNMQVDTNVAEGDVGRLHSGMEATFTVDAYPGRIFRGEVRQVRDNATTLQNVVTYDAVIDVDNSDMSLRPAMTANASFVYATRAHATRIANAALRFRPDAATIATMAGDAPSPALPADADARLVWVLRGAVAKARVVRIGIGDGVVTEVADGDVHAGEVVVTEAAAVDGNRHGS